MNIFEKHIVNWALKIQDSKEAQRHMINKKDVDKWKEVKEKINKLESEIYQWYDEYIKTFDINEYYKLRTGVDLDFAEGDIVILNKYGLRMDSNNPWDVGAKLLLRRGGYDYDKNPAPLFCKITKIYVDKSYLIELVDKFFDSYNYDEILSLNNNIVNIYNVWLEKRGRDHTKYSHRPIDYSNSIFEYNCLYVGATFETINYDFQPNWGLNIFSFLNSTSEEGKLTTETWREIHDINVKIEELNKKEKELKISLLSAEKNIEKFKTSKLLDKMISEQLKLYRKSC
jgi:hypothetical protein